VPALLDSDLDFDPVGLDPDCVLGLDELEPELLFLLLALVDFPQPLLMYLDLLFTSPSFL